MLINYLSTLALLLLLLGLWLAVQTVARRFAARHPETGPYQEAGAGCGGGCGSCGKPCAESRPPAQQKIDL